MRRILPLVFPLALLGCPPAEDGDTDDTDTDTDASSVDYEVCDRADAGGVSLGMVEPAPLQAGAAEGTLKLPVGTPLAGFTARCGCLGGSLFKVDDRDSHYSTAFIESAGVHVRPTIKVVWLESGGRHLVMTKTDTMSSFDGLVEAVTERLEELTGEELSGQVTHSANHNHASYGTISKHTGLFLGNDKFLQENFDRAVEQIAQVAFEAYQKREPARVGMGVAEDWDPNNRVYSDRRGDNNDLVVFEDMGPEQGGKDPHLGLLRVDSADGDPLAVVFSFGMHPYVFGEDVQLVTGDATALIEMEVAESFDEDEQVVAMFIQGSGGDASVRGSDDGWARMETVGVYARDAILDLWADTPLSDGDVTLETTTRSVPMNGDAVHVTRDGTVDWYYPHYDPELEDDYQPDNEVFGPNGEILTPLDEWFTGAGAVFCGSGDFDLPVGGLAATAPEYTTCMQVEFMKNLLEAFFRLPDEQVVTPMDGMRTTMTAGAMLDGIPVRRDDGQVYEDQDVLLTFFPGEPLHMYSEQFRRRANAELGVEDAWLFGYSMDHEGYLLIPEDWFRGGYEPDISFWGPLSGEYIMERVLAYAKSTLQSPEWEPVPEQCLADDYIDYELQATEPDVTEAEEIRFLTNETLPEYYYVPEGFRADLDLPTEIRRIDGVVQVGWVGGDPAVDDPRITLERYDEDAEAWAPVRSHTGRVINDDFHDFGIAYTPDPLFPADADQTHYWWATWQAVGHIRDRAGLPTGSYRLRIEGHRYTGGSTTYPWNDEPYELITDPFEVLPAEITITVDDDGAWLSLEAPSDGFRMIDIEGSSRGHNPLRGDLTVTWHYEVGEPTPQTVRVGAPVDGRSVLGFSSPGAIGLEVVDAYGNTGSWGDVGGDVLPIEDF